MRKVRYKAQEGSIKPGLTDGEIYDVVKYTQGDYGNFWDELILINDYGMDQLYDMCEYTNSILFFDDVTTEFRNEVIDGILE